MARTVRPLTDTQIKQSKPKVKEYSLSDGSGLALKVKPSGTKLWIFNYPKPFTKARTNISLGAYPNVSLANARKTKRDFNALLADDIDPNTHRSDQANKSREAHENTLEAAYRQWLKLKQGVWSPSYLDRLTKALELHVIPALGNIPIHKINAPHTIKIIQPLADRQALESVRKLCRWLNEIMVFAVNTGQIHSNPLAGY